MKTHTGTPPEAPSPMASSPRSASTSAPHSGPSLFAGLPMPGDAPPSGACVRIERPEPGLARLVLDPPHKKLALFDVPLLMDLERALDELARDTTLKGLVITGKEPLSFAAGADIETIQKLDTADLAAQFARSGQALFQRLHRLSRGGGGRVFVVAAVGGPVPGGACELCLACDRIVLADSEKSRIGLPEVLLGILPAWGGSQRLPRRLGVPAALGAILTGKLHNPRQALKLGLVDRLAPAEYLVSIATEIAAGRMSCTYRGRVGMRRLLIDKNPLVTALVASQAKKKVLAETKGHYPAPLAAIPLVTRAPRTPLEQGLRHESEAVRPLSTGEVARSLLGLFLLSEDAKKTGNLADGKKAAPIERAAVIGAGVMGAGIASLMAERGVDTRLRDLDRAQLDAAVLTHRSEIEKKRQRKQLQSHQANAAIDRLMVTSEARGFARCQLVIEAVAERLEVKRAVFRELATQMAPDAILATNTSSLSVTAIAEGLPNPERVVGMHFFNPPRKMPLVEIVRGAKTSEEVVRRTARLALDLGKTPVITKDVAGFLVNRILGPYLDEAVRLVQSGVDPDALDRALVSFGMPMGPCELLDEVGLDIASHAGASLEKAYGERMQAATFLKPLVEAKELGKKTGTGLFLWSKEGGKPRKMGVNPRVKRGSSRELPSDEMVDRCVLAMANEAVRCLAEEVVEGPRALDLATVYGTGFAPFRGGILRHVDTRGLSEVAQRLAALRTSIQGENERLGRYEPAPLLTELARAGKKLHG
ncbi:MAG: 3-hydroxyacyl-CoA dehydrogenase NAD-binding domain-containing protein [Planctomycetota bacterium]